MNTLEHGQKQVQMNIIGGAVPGRTLVLKYSRSGGNQEDWGWAGDLGRKQTDTQVTAQEEGKA